MACDRRGYYYRSIRDGDRVRRVYLGRGPAAQLAALLDEERRSEHRERSLAWRAEEARWEAAAARQRALDELGEMVARAALLAAGYHQHDRGAWRRRRMSGNGASNGRDVGVGRIARDGAAPFPGEGPASGDEPPPAEDRDPWDR